jgi:hypothetical protein
MLCLNYIVTSAWILFWNDWEGGSLTWIKFKKQNATNRTNFAKLDLAKFVRFVALFDTGDAVRRVYLMNNIS